MHSIEPEQAQIIPAESNYFNWDLRRREKNPAL
jgi:hypothetical protein